MVKGVRFFCQSSIQHEYKLRLWIFCSKWVSVFLETAGFMVRTRRCLKMAAVVLLPGASNCNTVSAMIGRRLARLHHLSRRPPPFPAPHSYDSTLIIKQNPNISNFSCNCKFIFIFLHSSWVAALPLGI